MKERMESSIVIKIKFGDTLRRFNECVVDNGKLELNMEALRSKIQKLFSLDPEADYMLTYTDCDGDVVTLVDDNDLDDVMMQRLNPFRIEVAQTEEGSVNSYSGSLESSTSTISPNFQDQLSVVNVEESNAVQVMLSEPVPADTLSGEIADFFPQSGQSSTNQLSQFEKISSTANRASENSQFLSDEVIMRFSRSIVDTRPIGSASGNKGKNVIPASGSVDISPPCPDVSRPLPTPPSPSPSPSGLEPADMFPDASNVSAFNNKNNTAKEGDDQLDQINRNRKILLDKAMKRLSQSISDKRPTKNTSGNTRKSVNPVTASVNLNTPSPAVSHPLPCPPFEDAQKFPVESNVPAFDKKKHTEKGHESQLNDTALSAGSYAAPSSGTPAATSLSDGLFSVHSGVICDGCDAYPITGPRFKSKVKDNYDLCSICFSKMGKEEEYFRIDHPLSFPSVSQKLLNDPVRCSHRCASLPPCRRKGLKDPAIIGSNIEQISKPYRLNIIRKRVLATSGKKTSDDKKTSFKKNNATLNPAIPYSHESTSLFGKRATTSPCTRSDEGSPGDKKAIEQMLMSDLEDLGFDQIDLNKKVLRKNDYDIDEAVKDLIAAVKWDPAIEELEKMGFVDVEMNKSMLLKHDGCLWSALMGLIDAYGL